MGYRSEVAFVTFNLPIPDKFKELLADCDCDFLYKKYPANDVQPTDEVWRAGMMESVKWSSTGIEDEFEQWCMDNAENTLFVRMGEDIGDEDIYGELWDNPFDIGIHRYINVDSGESESNDKVNIFS